MLISKGASIGEIVTILTNFGEEIIGRLDYEDEKEVLLNKPCVPVSTQKGVSFAPRLFTTDVESVPFSKDSLLVKKPLAAGKDAADLYIQRTTGIALG